MPVQVNVIGTTFFLIAVGFVVVATFIQGRQNRPPKVVDRPDATPTPAAERALAPAAEA